MDCARPKTSQEADSAAAALTALVRLLARQAAREWRERKAEDDRPLVDFPEKPR